MLPQSGARPLKAKCWLIGSGSKFPVAAGRIARLRGIDVALFDADNWATSSIRAARNQLVAINFDLLSSLSAEAKAMLRGSADNGATIYVRGGLEPDHVYSLQPFSDQRFEFSINHAGGCRYSSHPLLPAAIAGEQIEARVMTMPQALGLDARVRPLLSALHPSECETASIFAIEIGAGVVIFDLHGDEDKQETDLLEQLAEPSSRASAIGALAAVDWAAGRDPATPAPIDLVIDDRPTNFDYFSAGRLDAFLDHLETLYPGIHIDFAWTPRDTRPHRPYLDVLRGYNTGFVWHGFLRHIDHRTIADYDADLVAGRARLDKIWRDYGVRFQPVMVFPFEKDTPDADALLRRSGFIAKAQSTAGHPPPAYYILRDARDLSQLDGPFAVVFRDSVEVLTRERMVAVATLGSPIVALAHPRNLGLRRFGRRDPVAMSYFDPVVKFAAEKSLRPMSLEEIAAYVRPER